MNCELCGSKVAQHEVDIEGTTMKVCNDCSRFGVVKNKKKTTFVVQEKRAEIKETEYIFIKGYGSILKKAREKLGLKQEEMAKRLNERESMLHQIESEHFKPSIALAKKLERELRIKIIEEIKDEETNNSKSSRDSKNSPQSRKSSGLGLTIGDILKK